MTSDQTVYNNSSLSFSFGLVGMTSLDRNYREVINLLFVFCLGYTSIYLTLRKYCNVWVTKYYSARGWNTKNCIDDQVSGGGKNKKNEGSWPWSRSPDRTFIPRTRNRNEAIRRDALVEREFRVANLGFANEIVIDYRPLKHGSRRITAWLGLIRAAATSRRHCGPVSGGKRWERQRQRERERRGYRAPCSSAGEPSNSAALFDPAAGSSYSLFSCSFWLDGTSQHFNGIPRFPAFEEELWGCLSVRLVN